MGTQTKPAKIQILSNTNFPLVDVLKAELIESTSVKIAVAFLRKTGLEQIHKALDYALHTNNANVEIIVGLDFKTTDYKALVALKEIEKSSSNFNFFCFGDKKDNHNELVFHPKMYLFDKSTENQAKYTSIVGSSNLTGGGLTTNFEVNSIFKEEKPNYYSQLFAIYNEIKYTDSIFCPSEKYISRYSDVRKVLEKSEAFTDTDVKNEIQQLRGEQEQLPGTVPTLKKVIIEFMKQQESDGVNAVALKQIYASVIPMIEELNMKMKMDTIENTIRGEFNKHEVESKHKDCMSLFKRVGTGLYSLTDKSRNYQGR